MKKALIIGVSGQDGTYLSKSLLASGWEVIGTSRELKNNSFINHKKEGIYGAVKLVNLNPTNYSEVLSLMKFLDPDEVYNLSGQSSVILSFQRTEETVDSVIKPTLNVLEVIRRFGLKSRFFNAASSECFGGGDAPANESTPFNPKSPYGIAKTAALMLTRNYREAYGLYACSGILFNHESPLRGGDFVTGKIINVAARIAEGRGEKLHLGNINITRDWGWAPEYVEAMRLMLSKDKPEDFVVSTGESHSLAEFLAAVFGEFGLDWKAHTETDNSLLRPLDLVCVKGTPSRIKAALGWQAGLKMKDLIKKWIDSLDKAKSG
ncbi:MAG: GDP-mannose 4,6-dehydratase [Elusimicrobia bacterium]|nr:GDP-mannose 4,6-dehydratase [Elusimicrobiota bacterium]